MRKLLPAVLPLLLLTACAWWIDTEAFRYDRIDRPAKPADHPVPILADTSAVERPYVVIGMVRSEPATMVGIFEGEMKQEMRRAARKMGGDALVNLRRRPAYGHFDRPVEPRTPGGDRREELQFLWTAEVITYDLPAAAPGDLGAGDTEPELP